MPPSQTVEVNRKAILVHLRKEGMSRSALAVAAQLSAPYVSDILNGKVRRVSLSAAAAIAEALDVEHNEALYFRPLGEEQVA